MTSSPEVSVIIPTYNGSATLPMQLDALVDQTDAPSFEVIVVDNGSKDGVADVARRWASKLDLAVISAPEHQGISHARNTGIRHARAEKLAFCDDDDVVGAHWVQAAAKYLDLVEFVSGDGKDIPAQEFTSVDYARSLFPEPETFRAPIRALAGGTYPILLGGNCAIRAETMRRLQGFDRRFDPGAEEKDLALRYEEQGGTLMFGRSLRLAVRLRPNPALQRKRTREHGRMSLQLLAVHGLLRTSHLVNNPDFRVDLLRCGPAALKMLFRKKRDWNGLADRFFLRLGQVEGWIRYVVFRRVPESTLSENQIG